MTTTLKTVQFNPDGTFTIIEQHRVEPWQKENPEMKETFRAAVAAFHLAKWFHSAHREIKAKQRAKHKPRIEPR